MPDESGDLLIAAPARWDEACFAVPAIRALQRTGWNISLLCQDQQEAFWNMLPELPTITTTANESARSLAKRIHGSWKSAIVWEDGDLAQAIRKATIPRTIGPQGPRWAKWLSDPVELAPKPKAHRVEYYLSAARSLGQETNDPALFRPASQQEKPNQLLLVPDSDFGTSHEWSLDRWKELADRLLSEGTDFQVATPCDGRSLGSSLVNQLDGVKSIPIAPTADALPTLGTYARLIAADGSLPHLASHAGAACLTLFGPNDPVTRRPLGVRHTTSRQHVECAPCRLAECPLDQRCQKELTVERVFGAWLGSNAHA